MRINTFIIAAIIFPSLPAVAWGQSIGEELKVSISSKTLSDTFGYSIDIEGTNFVVGAVAEGLSGAAYLFDATTGTELAQLMPVNGLPSEASFGTSVAVQGDVVAVGASKDTENGQGSGSAFLFDASTGVQIAKLLPSDGQANAFFGHSIDIEGNIVAIGAFRGSNNGVASGAVYLFDATTGSQIMKLAPSDGEVNDYFGLSVAIDSGFVVVGAVADDGIGSAYVFDAATGAQIAKLLPDGDPGLRAFGMSVAIEDGTVVVGDPHELGGNGLMTGAVYVFDAQTGARIAKIFPFDEAVNSNFGQSVAIQGDLIVAGAHQGYGVVVSGAAYLFDATTYAPIAKLLPREPYEGQRFGYAVSVDNETIAVGAYQGGGSGYFSGSAYIFDSNAVCSADLAADGVLDFFDISVFLNAFSANDLRADFTNDGTLNFFDVSTFLNEFAAGCP